MPLNVSSYRQRQISLDESQQACTIDRGRYNKSTCANRVVTKISPAPSVQLSISEPRLPTKMGTTEASRTSGFLNIKTSKQPLETRLLDSYNPYNLRIIVKLFSLPVVFPN